MATDLQRGRRRMLTGFSLLSNGITGRAEDTNPNSGQEGGLVPAVSQPRSMVVRCTSMTIVVGKGDLSPPCRNQDRWSCGAPQ